MRHSPYRCCPTDDANRDMAAGLPKVLTIDDDPHIAQALKRRFRQYKVTLLQAHHGTHGIWLATSALPDVIITDLRMPQGRGQDVVAYLARDPHTRQIPIIVLTGLLDDELRSRMLALGVDAYFTKPVSFDQLRDAVARHVSLQKADPNEEETLLAANAPTPR